jgi:hypothetical protein
MKVNATMHENTWSEFWNSLQPIPFRILDDGTVLIKPPVRKGHTQLEVAIVCRKKVRNYRIMHFRIWESGGFTSHLFLWNTASDEIKSLEGLGKFSFIVQRMMFYCAQGLI